MQIRRGMKLKEGSGLFVSEYTLYVYVRGEGIKADKGNKSGTNTVAQIRVITFPCC